MNTGSVIAFCRFKGDDYLISDGSEVCVGIRLFSVVDLIVLDVIISFRILSGGSYGKSCGIRNKPNTEIIKKKLTTADLSEWHN
jgi:hypothetical protein